MIINGNQYIQFEIRSDTGKTQSWAVINKSGFYSLGLITWYAVWRQYIFQPTENSEYNATCLDAISAFIKRLNGEHRIVEVA